MFFKYLIEETKFISHTLIHADIAPLNTISNSHPSKLQQR